jgi:molybdopterin molybdotransferase
MISVDQARARIIESLTQLGLETVALANAHGRVLGVPLRARIAHPPADVSAMDGYAVRAEDAKTGARLQVVGEAPAGHPFAGVLKPGEALRLFTGSFVPEGADTILIQENAVAEPGAVIITEAPGAGRHIRPKGQDFAADDVLIPAPKCLTVRDISLAAAANHPWLRVVRRPRIAVLATGDEISLPGEPIGRGGIVNSNSAMLAAFVTASGGEALVLPAAGDDAAAIAVAAEAARGADLLVTTGGASVGAHDQVQAGLARHGFALDFWKIAMRPGKPLIFGHAGDMPVLGLPGNPVSSYVCAVLFLGPAMAAMAGLPVTAPVFERARLQGSLPANDQREDYLRATLDWRDGGWAADPFARQDSAMLAPLARADALLRRPPFQGALADGDEVEIIRLAL